MKLYTLHPTDFCEKLKQSNKKCMTDNNYTEAALEWRKKINQIYNNKDLAIGEMADLAVYAECEMKSVLSQLETMHPDDSTYFFHKSNFTDPRKSAEHSHNLDALFHRLNRELHIYSEKTAKTVQKNFEILKTTYTQNKYYCHYSKTDFDQFYNFCANFKSDLDKAFTDYQKEYEKEKQAEEKEED